MLHYHSLNLLSDTVLFMLTFIGVWCYRYTCPICSKTALDLTRHWEMLDQEVSYFFFTARSLYIDRETIFGCNLRFRILECLFLSITRNNLEAASEKQTFQQLGDILSRWYDSKNSIIAFWLDMKSLTPEIYLCAEFVLFWATILWCFLVFAEWLMVSSLSFCRSKQQSCLLYIGTRYSLFLSGVPMQPNSQLA